MTSSLSIVVGGKSDGSNNTELQETVEVLLLKSLNVCMCLCL